MVLSTYMIHYFTEARARNEDIINYLKTRRLDIKWGFTEADLISIRNDFNSMPDLYGNTTLRNLEPKCILSCRT